MPITEDGTIAAEAPAPPQFPQTAININQQGMLIQYILAPGLAISQMIDEKSMNEIAGKWLETRRELKKQQTLAADVLRSKGKK